MYKITARSYNDLQICMGGMNNKVNNKNNISKYLKFLTRIVNFNKKTVTIDNKNNRLLKNWNIIRLELRT